MWLSSCGRSACSGNTGCGGSLMGTQPRDLLMAWLSFLAGDFCEDEEEEKEGEEEEGQVEDGEKEEEEEKVEWEEEETEMEAEGGGVEGG